MLYFGYTVLRVVVYQSLTISWTISLLYIYSCKREKALAWGNQEICSARGIASCLHDLCVCVCVSVCVCV